MKEFKSFFIISLCILSTLSCDRERCCSLDTCTSAYCVQKNTETWVSDKDYSDYQYTKLTLSNNDCLPCPYNCKSCSDPSSCDQCLNGFYMDSNNECQLCGYKCNICQVINSITKCSQCQEGTYLDTTTLTCASCPSGAKSCSNQYTIVQCESGYLKSSNSLYCTACPSNCIYCPISDSYCSSCSTGYYLSSGACNQCSVSNCDACIGVGSNVYCTDCSQSYYVTAGTCLSCPSNCLQCAGGSCSQCQSGYYVNSGSCSTVSSSTTNCQIYQDASTCSSCVSGYYYSSTCLPCSILCSTCQGIHFGRCQSCNSDASLYNQMCIVDPFPAQSYFRRYVGIPGNLYDLSGGSVECTTFYMGTTIQLQLNDLSSYKITLSFMLFSISSGQAYTVTFNNDSSSLTTSSTSYDVCGTLYIHQQSDINFSDISINNTLTFSSSQSLYLAQILILAYKCNDLCLQCTQSVCYTCLTDNLYTQDAYCVYTCSQGYYTYETGKECVTSCPSGTYAVLADTSCVACVSPCLTCSSAVVCLTCIQNYYLRPDSTCQETCPDKYYGSTKTQQCQECIGRCQTCISQDECLSCNVGFLQGTQCVDTCADTTYYADLDTLNCQLCDSSCATCQYLSTYCLTCASSLFYFNNTCLTQCPDTYYESSPNCQSCSYPCQNCQGSASTCLSCWDKYLLGSQCVSTCPDAYYENNIDLTCEACATGCSLCYAQSTNCLSCESNYYLYGAECLSICPDQYYPNSEDNVCEKCVNLCLTCLNSTYCLSCNSNFLYDGECVRSSQCPSGDYADISTLTCMPCNSSCLTCQISATTCTSCSSGTYLYENSCQSSCPTDYYYALGTQCLACEQPCLTCFSQSECLSCINGYKYSASNYVCSSTCSVGTYFNASISDCTSCSSNCLMCNSEQFCLLCEDAYYLYVLSTTSNQCISTCPDGYYADSLVCQACLYPCQTCTSSIDCLTCVTGLQYESRCISGCPQSTYMINDTCASCQGNCLTCEDTPTTCLSCVDNYYLEGSQCVTECSVGTYAFTITQACQTCPTTCSQCTNATHCTLCLQNQTYLDNNNSCVQYCSTGYYGDDSTGFCQFCQAKCYTCSGNSGNCLTCADNYLLVKLENAEFDCMTSCPSLYYSDNSICYSCIFPCSQCSSVITCTSCASGTYFHSSSGNCLLTCPMGTFYETSSFNQCIDCQSPCQTCTSLSYCISCLNGLKLYEGTCVSSCPSQYYGDNSGICLRCYGLCETCSGKYTCLTCHAGYAYEGFCYSACPPGTYADSSTKTCQMCQSPCLQCSLLPSYCSRCLFNLYAYKGQCSSTCPTGTYASGDECQVCLFPCIDCTNQFTCQECLGGYLLYMQTSCIDNVQKCPNDLYKMDSKECVPMTWCPSTYYKDETLKTCSTECSREKYIDDDTKTCIDECESGYYVGEGMVCKKWSQNTPQSLLGMSTISFIQSSEVYIVIIFNETISWVENSETLYTLYISTRRLLLTSNLKYKQVSEQQLKLRVESLPHSGQLNLPAHYLVSKSTNYPLQNPTTTVYLPQFTPYSYSQIYTGSIMGQFSEGISWFILLFSLFFLFMNRLSDLYVLWDTVQLLYLLVFLNVQYPPNVNEFLLGMSNNHFLFLPSLFSALVSDTVRDVSDQPFYAYSFDSNFLRTGGKSLLLVVVVIGIYFFLKIAQLIMKKCQCAKQKSQNFPKFKKFVFKGILRYRWHHFSDIMFVTYDIILLFAVAELVHIGQNPDNAGSNVLSVICLLAYLLFPIFVGYKLYKHFPNISRGKMVQNLQCFYRGIEKTNKFGIALIEIRYIRKILYCIIIGVFSKSPMFAIPILMFSSVLMGLFLFVNMPFKKRISNILTVGTEIVLVLFYIIIALINFQIDQFSADTKYILGWFCTFILIVMVFALIFQVFCKTMFYLQPQQRGIKQEEGQMDEEFLRKKAGQFFDHIFPKIKHHLNLDNSQDGLKMDYEDGDSQNSQNNDLRAQRWGIQDDSSHQDQFRHYRANSDSDQTQAKPDNKNPPQFLIRCVKEFD